ncbi:MAG TPA: hypothetical protein VNH11_16420 [Pirellulales bacterium]|nr:hypothetical protein [Pirellulales bacterium]
MSTSTQLERYSRHQNLHRTPRVAPDARLRELWADALATVAMVTLASTVVVEALRILM